MRALVTGGTGYLGSFLVREWARRHGHDMVTCLVPPQGTPLEIATRERFERMGIRCIEGDLRLCPVSDELSGGFDVVFHLAASPTSGKPGESPALVNVQGTANLLQTLRGRLIGKRIVFTSSTAAVDRARRPRGPLTEESPCAPRSANGKTKLEAEKLLRAWCEREGASWTIARLSALYGPGVRSGLVPMLASGLRQGSLPTRLVWPGRVSLLYIEDAVALLLFLAGSPQAGNQTFFLSSGEEVRLGDLVKRIATHLRPERPPVHLPDFLWTLLRGVAWLPGARRLTPWRLLHALHDGLWCDSSRVRGLYSSPLVGLDEGLRRTFRSGSRELSLTSPSW